MKEMTTEKGVKLMVPERGEKHSNAGRPKGAKNVMTRKIKEALIRAAGQSRHAKAYVPRRLFYLFGRRAA